LRGEKIVHRAGIKPAENLQDAAPEKAAQY
jgi:hypothetical protein